MSCLDAEAMAAFAEGRLDGARLAEAEAHAAGCATCHALLVAALRSRSVVGAQGGASGPSSLPRSPPGAGLRRGATVRRYTVLAPVGRGGMGEVYAAYDAELNRKVALKLLHGQGGARGEARLLGEARALAKVSHPNVVAVHEAGTVEGRVFIAMDYVEGTTLADWLAARARSTNEILTAFVSAARGLGAAHAAGLVHRDFKPSNVMVARDGAVRVMDFGLARTLGDAPATDGTPSAGALDARDRALTMTGELIGTPAYMSPEQFRAAPTDARSDQFSFCVALHEALYGAPPFVGATAPELMAEVLAGRVRPPPAKSNVAGWLRRVLLRGLAVDPAARWPSMEALAAALVSDPRRGRWRLALGTGILALVGLAIATLVRDASHPESLCRGGAARLAGAWEPQRREATRRAFVASGAPAAPDVWERVAPLLDRYVVRWLAMYTDACEATQVRREVPPAVLDLRMSCLDERRTALAALTDVLVTADRGVVEKAVEAANALPGLERCADLKLLRTAVEAPRDEATRHKVDDLRRRAAVAKAVNDTGKHKEAIALHGELLGEARALGYRPVLAEILHGYCTAFEGPNMRAEIVPIREEALWTALAAARDDLAAESAVLLMTNVGMFLGRPTDGWHWSRLARALLDRLGPGQERLRSWLVQGEATLHSVTGHHALALDGFRTALALKLTFLPADHPDVGRALGALAEELNQSGRHEEAIAYNLKAYAIMERVFGPASIEAAVELSNRGECMIDLGQAAEAVPILRDAAARWEAQLGPANINLGYPLTALGRALLAAGRAAEAVDVLARALRLREAGERSAELVAETRTALAAAKAALRK